jgi:hypothetical protein
MIPIKLVFQWRLMFDKKLKETSLPCYLTWNLTWKSGFGPYANEHEHKLILVPGWSGRWWRDRPRTDPSSVSDLGTDFSSTFVSRLLAFSSVLSFQLDQLIKTPFGLGVILVLKLLDFSPTLCQDSFVSSGLCIRYLIEYRIEPRLGRLLNMNLNKGRD